MPDLQYYHYHLQDLSSLIVQHQQNCGVDLTSSHKIQFVFAVQLTTIARGSLFPDKVAGTCTLQVAKAAVTLPTPNNQPRSVALEVETTMPLLPVRYKSPPPYQEIVNL